jgi:hypothetical protein
MVATDTKAHLVARLQETFAFCDTALASLDDTLLGEPLSSGGQTETRALALINAVAHWSDHYSQAAIYLRLNGLLPRMSPELSCAQPCSRPPRREWISAFVRRF